MSVRPLVMVRYQRPVRSVELFASAEMALRHPNESEISSDGVDEGVGRAFDNMDPSASAEREVWLTGDVAALFAWHHDRLIELGWRPWDDLPAEMQSDHSPSYIRDEGESFGLHVALPEGDRWIIPPGERCWGRVSYLVNGEWPK